VDLEDGYRKEQAGGKDRRGGCELYDLDIQLLTSVLLAGFSDFASSAE
jgi:hypothetical protein